MVTDQIARIVLTPETAVAPSSLQATPIYRRIRTTKLRVSLFRKQGGSVGIAFVTTLLARRTPYHQAILVAHATPFYKRYQETLGALSRIACESPMAANPSAASCFTRLPRLFLGARLGVPDRSALGFLHAQNKSAASGAAHPRANIRTERRLQKYLGWEFQISAGGARQTRFTGAPVEVRTWAVSDVALISPPADWLMNPIAESGCVHGKEQYIELGIWEALPYAMLHGDWLDAHKLGSTPARFPIL